MSGKALSLSLCVLAACNNGGSSPVVEAAGGGAGYWPSDSRVAVERGIERGYDALQLDIASSQDGVLLVVPTPVLEGSRCTGPGGKPLLESYVVGESNIDVLEQVYCGGFAEDAYPNASLLAAPPLRFDVLLGMLRTAPEVGLDLTLQRSQQGLADAVVNRWLDADLANQLVISSQDYAQVEAAQLALQTRGTERVRTAGWRLAGASGLFGDPVVGEGIWIHQQDLDRGLLRRLHRRGWWVGLWGVDEGAGGSIELAVDRVLTAYPEDFEPDLSR